MPTVTAPIRNVRVAHVESRIRIRVSLIRSCRLCDASLAAYSAILRCPPSVPSLRALTPDCNAAICRFECKMASIVARLRCDAMGDFGIGQPVPREEDPYLVRGAGRYIDDVKLIGQARGYVLRSPHAHARILSIDTQQAKQSLGVLLVLSGQDPEILALGLQRPWHPRRRRDGSPAFISPQPLLARERVRYIGDPVALVVADTLDQAKDAAELIAVDYKTLPAVPTIEAAIGPEAPAIWEDCPDNIAFLHELGDKAAVDKAFAAADHVVRHR